MLLLAYAPKHLIVFKSRPSVLANEYSSRISFALKIHVLLLDNVMIVIPLTLGLRHGIPASPDY